MTAAVVAYLTCWAIGYGLGRFVWMIHQARFAGS